MLSISVSLAMMSLFEITFCLVYFQNHNFIICPSLPSVQWKPILSFEMQKYLWHPLHACAELWIVFEYRINEVSALDASSRVRGLSHVHTYASQVTTQSNSISLGIAWAPCLLFLFHRTFTLCRQNELIVTTLSSTHSKTIHISTKCLKLVAEHFSSEAVDM